MIFTRPRKMKSLLIFAVLTTAVASEKIADDSKVERNERQTYPRNVVATLAETGITSWGSLGRHEFCGAGQFAVGFAMKYEKRQRFGDNTALNGIELICSDGGKITSTVGPWGSWGSDAKCSRGQYLVAYSLQVEKPQGRYSDDTAANSIKFECRSFYGFSVTELLGNPAKGDWGTFQRWSRQCPRGSAICGIQTRVEPVQNHLDDTALNDVKFFCCT